MLDNTLLKATDIEIELEKRYRTECFSKKTVWKDEKEFYTVFTLKTNHFFSRFCIISWELEASRLTVKQWADLVASQLEIL